MDVDGLLSALKLHARIDDNTDDAGLSAMLTVAAGDVAHAAAYSLPPTVQDLPEDLRFAIIDHAARLYDMRGADDGKAGLSLAAGRIVHRYRGVSLGAANTDAAPDA